MKKLFLLNISLFILFGFSVLFSQTLQFTNNIDKNGQASAFNNSFSVKTDKNIFAYLTLKQALTNESIYYEVYKLDLNQNEQYEKTIYQDIAKGSMTIFVNLELHQVGKYNIYAYTDDGILITSSKMEIKK